MIHVYAVESNSVCFDYKKSCAYLVFLAWQSVAHLKVDNFQMNCIFFLNLTDVILVSLRPEDKSN